MFTPDDGIREKGGGHQRQAYGNGTQAYDGR